MTVLRPSSNSIEGQLAGIEPEPLRRLYAYWLVLAGKANLPRIDAFRPNLLTEDLLSHLAVTEIGSDACRVLYRHIGPALTELYGENLTGRCVNDLFSESVRRKALESYRQVVDTRRPLYSKRVFNLWLKKLGYYRLMLPFAHSGEAVKYVIVGLYPMQAYLRRAEHWRSLPEAEEFFAGLQDTKQT